jgi:hypothetical protein
MGFPRTQKKKSYDGASAVLLREILYVGIYVGIYVHSYYIYIYIYVHTNVHIDMKGISRYLYA